MKTVYYLTIALIIFCSFEANSQEKRSFYGKEFVREGDKWYLVEDGERFELCPSIITIKWKSNTTQSQAENMNKFLGAKIIQTNILGYCDLRIPILGDVFTIAESYINSGLVESAKIATYGKYDGTPNDVKYPEQWALNQSNDADIDAPEAWGITTGANSVILGLLDSGLDWLHEDIGPGQDGYQNVWLNPGEDAWSNPTDPSTGNHIDDDGNGKIDDWKGWAWHDDDPLIVNNDTRSPNGHGTVVAGIAGAKTNNNKGIAGVAGGWGIQGIKILPVGTGDDGTIDAFIDDAILYAVSKGAKVINMSFRCAAGNDIKAALSTAYNDYGCFLVASAGNNYGGSVTFPAKSEWVVAVTHGEDGIKVIMVHHTGNLTRSLGLNYPEFPDSCLRIKFPLIVNIDEMFVHGFDRYLVQLGYEPLGEPDGFTVNSHLHTQSTVLID